MELITNNPFRVLGLLPSADSTAFAARIREFEMHDEGLDQPNFAMDFPVLGKTHRRYRFEIQMAAWKIRDLRGKMFHSFFWFHNTNSTDQLPLKCIAEENPEGALVIWNESIKRVNKTYSWKLNRAILSVWPLFAGKLPADKIGQIQQDIRLVTEQHLGEMQSYVLNNEDVAETWNRLVDTIGINKGYLDTIDEAIAANLDGISSIDFSVMVRDVARAAANIFEHSVKYATDLNCRQFAGISQIVATNLHWNATCAELADLSIPPQSEELTKLDQLAELARSIVGDENIFFWSVANNYVRALQYYVSEIHKRNGSIEIILNLLKRARQLPSYGSQKKIIAEESDRFESYKTNPEELTQLRAIREATFKAMRVDAPARDDPKRRAWMRQLDNIAGMSQLKETLHHEVIRPLRDPALYQKYGITPLNGLLFFGPPGCGKTYIARCLAGDIGYHYIEKQPTDLASKYQHGVEEKLGEIFREAAAKAPTILFFDEIDAFVPSRQSFEIRQHQAAEVNAFLGEMTECSARGILVIAATNRPDKLDAAILRTGRLDKLFFIPPPDFAARVEMLRMYLKNRPVSLLLDVSATARHLEDYVASDIKFIVNEAARLALRKHELISNGHFNIVLARHHPSISREQILDYERWRNSRTFGED